MKVTNGSRGIRGSLKCRRKDAISTASRFVVGQAVGALFCLVPDYILGSVPAAGAIAITGPNLDHSPEIQGRTRELAHVASESSDERASNTSRIEDIPEEPPYPNRAMGR
jgi:hypothetical protein